MISKEVKCSGCGEVCRSSLVCPKCASLGRPTFFCSQECFEWNWRLHCKIHSTLCNKNRNCSKEESSCGNSSGGRGGTNLNVLESIEVGRKGNVGEGGNVGCIDAESMRRKMDGGGADDRNEKMKNLSVRATPPSSCNFQNVRKAGNVRGMTAEMSVGIGLGEVAAESEEKESGGNAEGGFTNEGSGGGRGGDILGEISLTEREDRRNSKMSEILGDFVKDKVYRKYIENRSKSNFYNFNEFQEHKALSRNEFEKSSFVSPNFLSFIKNKFLLKNSEQNSIPLCSITRSPIGAYQDCYSFEQNFNSDDIFLRKDSGHLVFANRFGDKGNPHKLKEICEEEPNFDFAKKNYSFLLFCVPSFRKNSLTFLCFLIFVFIFVYFISHFLFFSSFSLKTLRSSGFSLYDRHAEANVLSQTELNSLNFSAISNIKAEIENLKSLVLQHTHTIIAIIFKNPNSLFFFKKKLHANHSSKGLLKSNAPPSINSLDIFKNYDDLLKLHEILNHINSTLGAKNFKEIQSNLHNYIYANVSLSGDLHRFLRIHNDKNQQQNIQPIHQG